MAKFLNETGLSHFWSKVKEYINSHFLAIGEDIEYSGTINPLANYGKNGIKITDGWDSGSVTSIDKEKIIIADNDDLDKVVINKEAIKIYENGERNVEINNAGITLGYGENVTTIGQGNVTTDILDAVTVTGDVIKRTDGTNLQVLLADGSIATLNAANGIPKLDANGRIPLSQLGNLDTTLFQVVTALPTSNIKSNRIYLLKTSTSGTQNIYAEYIYTGNVSATYDSTKWEKLGEYKADIDLTPYSKKTETVSSVRSLQNNSNNVVLQTPTAAGNALTTTINAATQSVAGVMTGADKKALDTLTARYPLSIASFTASPNLVEVGVAADITYSWSLNNTDFHPITAQGIVVDGAASVAVATNTKTYKKTGLAGATSATTKKATLTINGSLTKDVNVTYHYPSYIGVVANGTSITETVVKGLTKSIEWGKGKTATLTQSNQLIVYAYPASYGDLTSIKDGNGFEGFAGYTKTTLTVGGQTYNVYTQKLPATASSKYTFA